MNEQTKERILSAFEEAAKDPESAQEMLGSLIDAGVDADEIKAQMQAQAFGSSAEPSELDKELRRQATERAFGSSAEADEMSDEEAWSAFAPHLKGEGQAPPQANEGTGELTDDEFWQRLPESFKGGNA